MRTYGETNKRGIQSWNVSYGIVTFCNLYPMYIFFVGDNPLDIYIEQ